MVPGVYQCLLHLVVDRFRSVVVAGYVVLAQAHLLVRNDVFPHFFNFIKTSQVATTNVADIAHIRFNGVFPRKGTYLLFSA